MIALVGASDGGGDERKWQAMVPWRLMFELAPECFELSPGHDPPRWRTIAWPNEPTIAQLRAIAAAAEHQIE